MIAMLVLAKILGGDILNHNTNGDDNDDIDNMHDKPKKKSILNREEYNEVDQSDSIF